MTELMLSGLVCENCGVAMEDMLEVGYPRSCNDCTKENEPHPNATHNEKI